MAEIVLAFGLLTVMFLTVALLFGQLLKNSAKGSNVGAGVVFAEKVMDQAIASDLYGLPTGDTSEGIYSVDEGSQTKFFYRVEVQSVTPIAAVSTSGFVVRVPVWWWSEAPGQVRQGQGKQSFVLERFYTRGASAP